MDLSPKTLVRNCRHVVRVTLECGLMDVRMCVQAHALHVLPWYWLVIWGGGSLVVTALGMTILIVIPGFFLLGNIAWTGVQPQNCRSYP